MKKIRFKKTDYVRIRIELGKMVYGQVVYSQNNISYNKDVALHKKDGEYIIFVDVYNNKYVPEEGNLIREEKIIFETIEEVFEFLRKESILLENLYYK